MHLAIRPDTRRSSNPFLTILILITYLTSLVLPVLSTPTPAPARNPAIMKALKQKKLKAGLKAEKARVKAVYDEHMAEIRKNRNHRGPTSSARYNIVCANGAAPRSCTEWMEGYVMCSDEGRFEASMSSLRSGDGDGETERMAMRCRRDWRCRCERKPFH